MTFDPPAVTGLLLLALKLLALAAVGFVFVRVVLRHEHDWSALAQGLVVGPALWGLTVNFVLFLVPATVGVVAVWIVTLALGAGLAWRFPKTLRLPQRTIAGFATVVFVLFWIGLASRQLLAIPDPTIHLGLAASIQAGGWPPTLPWNPANPIPYHYGVDLLIALLAPPFGPDLALITELLGTYIWVSFILVVATTLLRYGGRVGALTLTPLLLTAAVWTLLYYTEPPDILKVLVPTAVSTSGVHATLTDVYWPSVSLPWTWTVEASPPNIWKPGFLLAYGLAFVVLERAAPGDARRHVAPGSYTGLALLIGFLGLVDESVALLVLLLWTLLEAERFLRIRSAVSIRDPATLGVAAGPALAAFLLVIAGGVITGVLTGASGGGLSLGWIADFGSRRPMGTLTSLPGGIGILGLGAVPVAAASALLAWRSRLVLALAAGSALFLISAFTLQYEYAQQDITRFDGHSRNFALLGLVVAMSIRLPALRSRWRYVIATCSVVLVIWPTIAVPVRNLGLALGQGVHLTNAQPGRWKFDVQIMRRHVIHRDISPLIVSYIRDHTSIDDRILSPNPIGLSVDTGRPNASGYQQFTHFSYATGPEYLDAVRYLDPAALRQLEFAYVHATDDWVNSLPVRARRWLSDPRLFKPLVRDGVDAVYQIQQAFLELDAASPPESFGALRQAVPASAKVYISPSVEELGSVRAASVLSHAQLFGRVRTFGTHLRPDFPIKPLGDVMPDLVVTSARVAPSGFAPAARSPIWWNDEIAVYSPSGAIQPIMEPPPRHFSVALSNVQSTNGRLAFTATFTDRATDRWVGQDWLVFAADGSPWSLPYEFDAKGRVREGPRWFKGQLEPVHRTQVHEYLYLYEVEPRTGTLALWDGGGYASLWQARTELDPGEWVLAVRLTGADWNEAALIPLLRFSLTIEGDFTYKVYQGTIDAAIP